MNTPISSLFQAEAPSYEVGLTTQFPQLFRRSSEFNPVNGAVVRRSAFRGVFTNAWLWMAIILSLAPQAVVIYVPLLQQAFSTVGLSLGDWLRCGAVASSVLWLRELSKSITRGLRD